jgi:Peptidase_C39 like family
VSDRHFVQWAGAGLAGSTVDRSVEPTETAAWLSPEVELDVPATDVIVSWTATTPPGAWLLAELRGRTVRHERTKWFTMGRWTVDDGTQQRASFPDQRDEHGDVLVDRFVAAAGHSLTGLQVRIRLLPATGATSTPVLRSVSVVATREEPVAVARPTSEPGDARGRILDVPRYSQSVHRGEYPQWDAGGEAWCSPTSTAMVLAYWGAGPGPGDCAWVDPAFTDPCVHHAVRGVYDYCYQGAGNWAFNVAYAGELGLAGFVTKLRSLSEAEAFISVGVPLVLSLSFHRRQIAGLDYDTKGHLLVLAGFSADGDPVLNDPASPDNAAVRKTVRRGELEAAWLSSSRGVAYVLHPPSVALPQLPGVTA